VVRVVPVVRVRRTRADPPAPRPPRPRADLQPPPIGPMFRKMLREVREAEQEMFRLRIVQDDCDDPDKMVREVIDAEDLYLHRADRFIQSVSRGRLLEGPSRVSDRVAACEPAAAAFDKRAARAMWCKAVCAVLLLVQLRKCVQRRYSPGGAGFKAAREEFESFF